MLSPSLSCSSLCFDTSCNSSAVVLRGSHPAKGRAKPYGPFRGYYSCVDVLSSLSPLQMEQMWHHSILKTLMQSWHQSRSPRFLFLCLGTQVGMKRSQGTQLHISMKTKPMRVGRVMWFVDIKFT